MAHTYKINNLDNTAQVNISVKHPDICPICHRSIDPVYVAGHIEAEGHAAISFLCRGCQRVFLTRYKTFERAGSTYLDSIFEESLPKCFVEEQFPQNIKTVSPNFSKIYNQALQAENLKLDELCGMGYRKSLEFLVKDYCIHMNPDKASDIQAKLLSNCIDDYIDNRKIKSLAKVCNFIGNNETHYQYQYDWGTIDDMKQFISALVDFISSDIQAAEAYNRLNQKFNHSQNQT